MGLITNCPLVIFPPLCLFIISLRGEIYTNLCRNKERNLYYTEEVSSKPNEPNGCYCGRGHERCSEATKGGRETKIPNTSQNKKPEKNKSDSISKRDRNTRMLVML